MNSACVADHVSFPGEKANKLIVGSLLGSYPFVKVKFGIISCEEMLVSADLQCHVSQQGHMVASASL